ncbi:DUF4199 domain-containing protein [Spongiivirga sp. MCCC 1A20706]|uniref:DUF4199 domain-containing protein n=1 Tax=Spongiivirga sp. MCCC 1A20706 TaxID=3160963 RepID=UPI0039778427
MKNFPLPIRFALATAIALISYFLVLSIFELHVNIYYSLFNGFITGFGIYEAIRYRRHELKEHFSYFQGFATGIITGFIATLLFTLFFAVYATEINTSFLGELSAPWFNNQNFKVIAFFTVAIMGFATSIVLTLSFMQLFKASNNPVVKAV